ncbi:protein-tyrosine phosphatase family protein [Pseudoroseicyclus sp. CXY001]|uniref:protein-tyrosine phosphatase family protein n=1 Tax=Pseudoroseicyclus sp. CXY001 TaxID=3242492 RepID=UPI003571590C
MPEFNIHALPVAGGELALSPLPGRTRHYGADLPRLLDWRPALVVTLCEPHELARMGAATLGEDLAAAGVAWAAWPIPDYGVPGEGWEAVTEAALGRLRAGGRVLVHCFGGCGRSGMVVLRLMIAAGETPEAALARLRAVRPCAVETEGQMAWAVGDRA